MSGDRLASRDVCEGKALLLELGPPPANVLDQAALAAIQAGLEEAAQRPGLKAVIIAGAGRHFSYGASIPEHLPGKVEQLLPAFHGLLRSMNDLPLPPLLAAVQGRCLGGGLELALACDLIQAAPDAELALPEVRLAVFPPAGSLLLGLRAPAGLAAELTLTGRSLTGAEALRTGVADLAAPAGEAASAAEAWVRENLLPRSGAALRHARRAARRPWREAVERHLSGLESQYLSELMATHDAVEGLQAFLEKREPVWKDR